jgi:hypothetical protein
MHDDTTEAEASADSIRVRPIGSDVPGRIVVRLPESAKAAGTTLGTFEIHLGTRLSRESRLALDVEREVPVGALRLSGAGRVRRVDGTKVLGVQPWTGSILSGQVTELTLAGFRIEPQREGEAVLGVHEFRFVAGALREGIEEDVLDEFGRDAELRLPERTEGIVFPRFPGSKRLRWGILDGDVLDLISNEVAVVDVHDGARRSLVKIAVPAAELPDCKAIPSGYEFVATGGQTHPSLPTLRMSRPSLPRGGKLILGLAPWNLQTSYEHVLTTPASTRIPLTFDRQAGAVVDVGLARLDVDDVEIPGLDGARMVPGTFTVRSPDGQSVAGPCTTSTGVDLVPGDYELVVDYQTLESGKKTIRMDVHVPAE